MKKIFIIGGLIGFSSAFLAYIIYDVISKPDGYLYLDKETKAVYATMTKDPDKFAKGSKLIFIFKK